MSLSQARPCHNVLILYSGGTIGMRETATGLAPAERLDNLVDDCYCDLWPSRWELRETPPLLDSADINPAHWERLAGHILNAVEQGYDAVLLLHGTDTLAYSAAALAFRLLGLNIPVILSGSMLPAGVPGSDAGENLNGALCALATGIAPGVHIHFHGQLLSAVRTSKRTSEGRTPFCQRPALTSRPRLTPLPATLCHNHPQPTWKIIVLPLYPGIDGQILEALMSLQPHGLILECYGSGTGPGSDPFFLASLQQARSRQIPVLAISQCWQGQVDLERYQTSSRLQEAGIISGFGLTREAALGKLHRLLALNLCGETLAQTLVDNLCGELD